MTSKKFVDESNAAARKRMTRLLRWMEDETVSLSDTEIEQQVRDEGEDPSAVAGRMRGSIKALLIKSGKKQMAAAREQARTPGANSRQALAVLPLAQLRKLVEAVIANSAVPGQLSLAFREGKFQSEGDLRSLAADLADLGLLDDGGTK